MAVRAKNKRFIIRADQAQVTCDVSGWDPLGVSISNPTVQYLFLPSINDWVAPNSRGTFALGGDPTLTVQWGAPPGVTQPVGVTSPVPQQASIVLTDQPLPNAGGPITITASVAVTWADGTVALPGFANQNDLTMGLYRPSANVFGFSVAGVEIMRLISTGLRLPNTFAIIGRNAAGTVDFPLIHLSATDKVVINNQAPGADGTVLTADAATSGGMKWSAVSGGQVDRQTFTALGANTWTKPANAKAVAVILFGAGGGGGAGRGGATGANDTGGGGGGGGVYAFRIFDATALAANETVTIGTGGTAGVGGAGAGTAGGTGGTSTFGTHMSAPGGGGGAAGAINADAAGGVAGSFGGGPGTGGNGGADRTAGGAGDAGSGSVFGGPGGGGGGMGTNPANNAGGAGGTTDSVGTGGGGAGGAAGGTAGTAGTSNSLTGKSGTGGGGGGAKEAGVGGAGGAGGTPCAGAGGGGAGATGGNGGVGGRGECIVITYF